MTAKKRPVKKTVKKAPRLMDRLEKVVKTQTRQEQHRTAVHAQQWLKDETLNRALGEIRAETVELWSKSRDPETRERAWLMMQSLNLFVGKLSAFVSNETFEQDKERRADAREQGAKHGATT